jgi:hypothetical protein
LKLEKGQQRRRRRKCFSFFFLQKKKRIKSLKKPKNEFEIFLVITIASSSHLLLFSSEGIHGHAHRVLGRHGRLHVFHFSSLLDQSVRPHDAAAGLGPAQLLEGVEGAVAEEVVLERVLGAPVGLVERSGSERGRGREEVEQKRKTKNKKKPES